MLFRNILFLCMLMLAFQVFSQEPKEIKKANKAFQDENNTFECIDSITGEAAFKYCGPSAYSNTPRF